MKVIQTVIAAAFWLATRMVVATNTNVTATPFTTLPPETTLRQALQLYVRIISGGQLDQLERAIDKHLKTVNLLYTSYRYRQSILAVYEDISSNCGFLKLSTFADVPSTKDLSDDDLFIFFRDLINKISERAKAISATPSKFKLPKEVKQWLIDSHAATSQTEIWYAVNRDSPYFCYNALLRKPGNLTKLSALFNDYTKAKAKLDTPTAATSQVSNSQTTNNISNTERTNINEGQGTTESTTPKQPETRVPTNEQPVAPAAVPSDGASEEPVPSPASPPMPTPPSTTEPASTESTSTNPAVPNAQDSSAAGGESTGTPSTPAPATGETTAPAEQPTQETTSNTSGSSASTTTGTTEQQAQQDAPQGENLKPAPSGSSASFNGLAVAVLSVLVVSSM